MIALCRKEESKNEEKRTYVWNSKSYFKQVPSEEGTLTPISEPAPAAHSEKFLRLHSRALPLDY